jgi:hypothetical protein
LWRAEGYDAAAADPELGLLLDPDSELLPDEAEADDPAVEELSLDEPEPEAASLADPEESLFDDDPPDDDVEERLSVL